MIDRDALVNIIREKDNSDARYEVYKQLCELAIEQSKASNQAGKGAICDAWMKVTDFCLEKMKTEVKLLRELNGKLHSMREGS